MAYEVININPLEHKAEILHLWTSIHPHLENLLPRRFTWIYENNPYGVPDSWFLRNTKGNAPIGMASIIPRSMWVNGEKVTAGVAADMMVDKNHRSLGPALMLQRALVASCEEGRYTFIYGFSPRPAAAVQLRAGFQAMGSCVRFLKILSTERFTRNQKMHYIARAAGGIIDTAIMAADFILSAKDLLKSRNISSRISDSFDSGFDQLWEKLPRQNLVVGDKTSSYLTWRYTMSPYHSHKIFTLANTADNILGYLVFSIVDQTIQIYDMAATGRLDLLLSSFIAVARRNYRVHAISFMLFAGCSIIPSLTRRLFLKRPDDLIIVVYCKKDFSSLHRTPLNWHLYAGDKDIG